MILYGLYYFLVAPLAFIPLLLSVLVRLYRRLVPYENAHAYPHARAHVWGRVGDIVRQKYKLPVLPLRVRWTFFFLRLLLLLLVVLLHF